MQNFVINLNPKGVSKGTTEQNMGFSFYKLMTEGAVGIRNVAHFAQECIYLVYSTAPQFLKNLSHFISKVILASPNHHLFGPLII